MTRTMYKLFWAWEPDKEEAWLNEMSARGLVLSKIRWHRYTFEKREPGTYAVRLEFLNGATWTNLTQNYLQFMEDTGAEYLGRRRQWTYFRKPLSSGGFDLFSDMDSRIRHLNRILRALGGTVAMLLLNLFYLWFVFWPQNKAAADMGMTAANPRSDYLMVAVYLVAAVYLIALPAFTYGLVRVALKMRRLKAERAIHE